MESEKQKMRKLKVLNKKVDSKKRPVRRKNDALDEKKIKEAYKAAMQLKDGAFSAIEKAYGMIKALKRGAEDLKDAEWNMSFQQDLENLLKARNALKEIG